MIEPRYGVLQTLFADRVFRIPHYQRFYSWKKRQREELFADLKKLAKGKEDQHHFMATIVCHKTEETKDIGTQQYRLYDIVDGQQRLTTLIILLKSIEMMLPPESEDKADLAKTLVKRDGHLILLQTNNANEFNFNQFLREGKTPEKIETHSDQNLENAIRECRQFVKSWEPDIVSLIRLILHRLGFVVFDTVDSRSVYTIFEVLNSRGLAVDWLDKTKSFLMGKAYELASSAQAAEAEIKCLQGIWGNIYREIAKEDVPGEEILRIMATLYYGPPQGKPRSAEDCLDILRRECNSFQQPAKISSQLLDVARKLVELTSNRHLGPVTDILHARLLAVAIKSAQGVNEDERCKLLEQWERVTFRIFGLLAKDSRTKVGDYVRLGFKIVDQDIETRTYNQIMTSLRQLGNEYPINKALEEGVIGKSFYDYPEKCRYLLWSYEEYLALRTGKNATIDENTKNQVWQLRPADSIEHIFPQTPNGSAWQDKMRSADGDNKPIEPHVNRVGNLLLLPLSLNQEAKNSPFANKKEIYAKHHLRMIDEINNKSDWTLLDIEAREAKIVEWAATRWGDV